MQRLVHDLLKLFSIGQVEREGNRLARQLAWKMDGFARQHRSRAGAQKCLRNVAHAAHDRRVAKVRVEILQMEHGTDCQRREVPHQHLRIGGAVDRPFTADALQAVRNGPREERHVQTGCNGLQQVVDPFLFDRVDGNDGMAGLNQRLEIACGVARHDRQGRSGCCDSMKR
jgi:hypothetical protein